MNQPGGIPVTSFSKCGWSLVTGIGNGQHGMNTAHPEEGGEP